MSVYNDDYTVAQRKPWWMWPLLAVIVIVVLIFAKGNFGGHDSSCGGGVLSTDSSTSNPEYDVPKDQFKGLNVSMGVHRCSGDPDTVGNSKPYVQVVAHVDGSPDSKSVVRDLQAVIRVYRKSSSGHWAIVKQTDTPEDKLQGKGTSHVVYDTDRRWKLGHVPTRVKVAVALTTDNDKPVVVRHSFYLP
jgi:hypothetical protein